MTNALSGSWVYKGLGDQYLWNTMEYNLVTTIYILPLTKPMTREMCSHIFVAVSWLKVEITTIASLLIIPSTERKDREKSFRWS